MLARLRAAGRGPFDRRFRHRRLTLSQLRNLPFDTVKIDQSFLARHGGTDIDTDGEVVLASIVGLAHDLKRAVVVEGVESEADAEWLASWAANSARAIIFRPPLTAAEALDYIARHYDIDGRPRRASAERSTDLPTLNGDCT